MPRLYVEKGNGSMIAHKIRTFPDLLRKIQAVTTKECKATNLPILEVMPDDGSMHPEALAAFDYRKIRLLVSRKLLNKMDAEANNVKVWLLFDVVKHELQHYEQYLQARKRKQLINKHVFYEEGAAITGRTYADNKIRTLTKEEINPKAVATCPKCGHHMSRGATVKRYEEGSVYICPKCKYEFWGKRKNPIVEAAIYGLGLGAGLAVSNITINKIAGKKNPLPKEFWVSHIKTGRVGKARFSSGDKSMIMVTFNNGESVKYPSRNFFKSFQFFKMGRSYKNPVSDKTPIMCMECGHVFKRNIGPRTYEIKCPKCGSYDTEIGTYRPTVKIG